jgi:glucan phosphoethanolaminetransferase (alkaline phosphatase superfamily)
MKINLAQIILGLGILVAMALSIALDSNGFYIRESLGEPGSWQTIFNPDTREVVATILSYIVLLSGLAIIGIAIAQLIAKIRSGYIVPDSKIKIRVRKLAITQIGLGILATVGAFFVIIWGFPTSYRYTTPDGHIQGVFFTPCHKFIKNSTKYPSACWRDESGLARIWRGGH